MANREDRIRQLEDRLSSLRTSSAYGANCDAIARIQLQLTQLYSEVGNRELSGQMMDEALRTLQDPLCPRTKATESMIRNIEYYKTHPNLLTAQSMPAIYRYLSLIILLVGYLALYIAYYFYHEFFVYNDFLVGILVVFIVSIGINFAIRSSYTRRASQR